MFLFADVIVLIEVKMNKTLLRVRPSLDIVLLPHRTQLFRFGAVKALESSMSKLTHRLSTVPELGAVKPERAER